MAGLLVPYVYYWSPGVRSPSLLLSSCNPPRPEKELCTFKEATLVESPELTI